MTLYNTIPPSSPLQRPPTLDITLPEIIKREPRFGKVIEWTLALASSQEGQELVCGDVLFEAHGRPWVDSLFGAKRQPPEVAEYYEHVTMTDGLHTPRHCQDLHRRWSEARTIAKCANNQPTPDAVLDSSEAYTLVAEFIHDLMPDCHNCGESATEVRRRQALREHRLSEARALGVLSRDTLG